MDKYDRDDSLDRSPFLMNDHDDYNTYSLDWPENVFGEELPNDVSDEDTMSGDDHITFNEELDEDEADESDRQAAEDSDEDQAI